MGLFRKTDTPESMLARLKANGQLDEFLRLVDDERRAIEAEQRYNPAISEHPVLFFLSELLRAVGKDFSTHNS